MKKLDFRLPNYDYVFGYDEYLGENEKQKKSIVFEKRGINTRLTDYSTILSCMYDGDENKIVKEGSYWLDKAVRGNSGYSDSLIVSLGGYNYAPINIRVVGLRPMISYSSIKDLCFDTKLCDDGIIETYFGSYPCNITEEKISERLEEIYNYNLGIGMLDGKEYTVDKTNAYADHKRFSSLKLYEYKYGDKKFVRVPVSSYLSHSTKGVVLSDENYHGNGSFVWLEVTPHKMLVDQKNDLAIFENVILAGIQFNRKRNYNGDFNKTFMKKYLDKYFSKEILPSTKYVDDKVKDKVKSL